MDFMNAVSAMKEGKKVKEALNEYIHNLDCINRNGEEINKEVLIREAIITFGEELIWK